MIFKISKVILRLVFIIFPLVIIENSQSAEDRGWSSSGGGEYIVTEKNPWFLGNSPVKWCISHGGEEQFSLSLEESKKEILAAINNLSSQFKYLNSGEVNIPNSLRVPGPIALRGFLYQEEGQYVFSNETIEFPDYLENGLMISDTFQFINDCDDAELEFILGKTNHPKIIKLKKEYSYENFSKLVGIAIRTNYSTDNFRSKGFIYIAADKGPDQYSGARSKINLNNTIWDFRNSLKTTTLFPPTYLFEFFHKEVINTDQIYMKANTTGLLEAVVAHELGHTFGFQHNTENDIMNIDYPANIVSKGIEVKGDFIRRSMIIDRSRVSPENAENFYFDWRSDSVNWRDFEGLEERSPLLHRFFFDKSSTGSLYDLKPKLWHFFKDKDGERNNKEISYIETYNIDSSLKFKKDKKYISIMSDACESPTRITSINIRRQERSFSQISWQFDPVRQDWVSIPSSEDIVNHTNNFVSFMNHNICGKIFVENNKYIIFKLTHNYFGNSSISFIDPVNYNSVHSQLIQSNLSPSLEVEKEKLWPQLEMNY